MCNLKIQGMDRAGEIDFRTDVEKEWTKENNMTQNKDLTSAAVRGEAVAESSAMRFRKKPVEIEAIQWTGKLECLDAFNIPELRQSLGSKNVGIPTLEGTMIAHVGDWIIKGVKGEFYPCKPDIFELTYVSPSAADAPSEPSDAEIVEIARQAIRAGSAMWDHFEKDDAGKFTAPVLNPKDFMLVRAVLAAVKYRAADALDSQPTDGEAKLLCAMEFEAVELGYDGLPEAMADRTAHGAPVDLDWPEDFQHENGNYMNRCRTCKQTFMGHKRRVTCKTCAAPTEAQSLTGGAVPDRDGRMPSELRDWLEGMSVSMDVSTGDHDAHHRYYGVVSEVMDDAHDKHGVTLLVCDAQPNFAAAPLLQVQSEALDANIWQALLKEVMSEIPNRFPSRNGDAPFHSHSIPGVWDSDNGAKAGTECAWCKVWNAARKALADQPPVTPSGALADNGRVKS